jgi:hypothetical protein
MRVFTIEKHLFELSADGIEHVVDLVVDDMPTLMVQAMVDDVLEKAAAESNVPPRPEAQLDPAPAVTGEAVKLLPDVGSLEVRVHHAGFQPGPLWWLDSRGTGDAVALDNPDPECLWAVGKSGVGAEEKGFVAQYNETTKETHGWKDLNDLLPLRLRRTAPPAWEDVLEESARGVLIEDPRTSGSAWRSEQMRAKMARGVQHRPVTRAGFPSDLPSKVHLKLWVYQLERAESLHLVWELPRVCALAFRGMDNASQKDWVRNGIDTWPKYTTALQFGAGQYQRGSQGAQAHARAKQIPLPGLMLAQLVAEPGATTVGVIVALLLFAHPLNKKGQHPMAPDNGKKAPIIISSARWPAPSVGFKVIFGDVQSRPRVCWGHSVRSWDVASFQWTM